MSFATSLTIGGTHFQPHALLSFTCMTDTLAVHTCGDCFMIEGSRMHACAIDLLNGLCKEITVSSKVAQTVPEWRVHRIVPVKRPVSVNQTVAAFEAIVPEGWLLFEKAGAWHFWPSKDLYAIALTASELVFVYAATAIEVTAPAGLLEQAFEAIKSGHGVFRHYTERGTGDYLNLLAVERLHGSGIRLRDCDFEKALRGRTLKRFHSLSSKLPQPLPRRLPGIDR